MTTIVRPLRKSERIMKDPPKSQWETRLDSVKALLIEKLQTSSGEKAEQIRAKMAASAELENFKR